MADYSVQLPPEFVEPLDVTRERKLAFRVGSKYLVLVSIVPILLGLAFSNGLFLLLTPVLLWTAGLCFVISLRPARKCKNEFVSQHQSFIADASKPLSSHDAFPSFYGSSYINALHPSNEEDEKWAKAAHD